MGNSAWADFRPKATTCWPSGPRQSVRRARATGGTAVTPRAVARLPPVCRQHLRRRSSRQARGRQQGGARQGWEGRKLTVRWGDSEGVGTMAGGSVPSSVDSSGDRRRVPKALQHGVEEGRGEAHRKWWKRARSDGSLKGTAAVPCESSVAVASRWLCSNKKREGKG
jgi:hypothetical protein